MSPQQTQKIRSSGYWPEKKEWLDASTSNCALYVEPLPSSEYVTGDTSLAWKQCIKVQGNAASPQSSTIGLAHCIQSLYHISNEFGSTVRCPRTISRLLNNRDKKN
jgi:hypothetical protein